MSSASQHYRLSDDLLGPVLAILDAYQDPYLAQGLVTAGCVSTLSIDGKCLQLGLCYPYPCMTQYPDIRHTITQQLTSLDAVDEVECDIDFQAASISAIANIKPIANVKQVIAVASGKGGWVNPPQPLIWH